MKQTVCKKCKKTLPQGCKYKYCEACRNQQVDTARKIGKPVLGVAVTAFIGVCAKIIKRKF